MSQSAAGTHEYHNYLKYPRGWKSWVYTLDHKRIGVMFLASLLTFFAVGGIFALLVRLELMYPSQMLLEPDSYNRLFTLHGAIMVFLFLVPSVPASLGNFLLPLHLGAKDVAFPRMNLASFYLYATGAIFVLYSTVTNSVDTGWTFYTPYSLDSNTAVVPVLLGVFIIGFSSIFTGINFITTIHKMRAPGMTWNRMPLFVWGLYATSIIQVLATPVLGITLLLLTLERALSIGVFDPALGGDPVLFQHFFWFYSHPAVYIMILPGMGVISEILTTHSHKRIFGYRAIALSSVAIALLGFLVWGHHMFVAGQSEISSIVFSLLTFLVGIPSGVKVFNWVATLYRGSISLTTPMLYALSFLFLFTIGGLTGIMLGALAADVHLHDTYFIVAHFHYVMVGGMVVAFFGGIYNWWPKMFGKMYSELWGKIGLLFIFMGFNITFFPQFVMGSQGMPRRYYTYIDEYHIWHLISTVGSWVLGVGILIAFLNLLHSLLKGKPAPANPWEAVSLEWKLAASPPDVHNFDRTPIVTHGPYDFEVWDEMHGDGAGDGARIEMPDEPARRTEPPR